MAKTSDTSPDFCREGWKYWIGREFDGPPEGWMDDMIMRLLEYANRRMIRLEDKKNVEAERESSKLREEHDRLFTRLARDVPKLISFEMARAAKRGVKVASSNEGALEELIRRIDRLAEARGTDKPPETPDE
jgi:hypothetical protein